MNTMKQDIETLATHYKALTKAEKGLVRAVTGEEQFMDWTLFTPSWMLFDSHVDAICLIHNLDNDLLCWFIFTNECGESGMNDIHCVDDFIDSLG